MCRRFFNIGFLDLENENAEASAASRPMSPFGVAMATASSTCVGSRSTCWPGGGFILHLASSKKTKGAKKARKAKNGAALGLEPKGFERGFAR